MNHQRIQWIDAARAFGIFFIYLGHFGERAGSFYPWVYSFHVALFFFLSGCTETFSHRSFLENLKHKAWTLLVPFFAFGLLNIFYEQIVYHTGSITTRFASLAEGGIRNQIQDGYGLWFFTCLFCVSILFSMMKKLPEKLLLPVSILLFLLADLFLLKGTFADFPRLPYNLDDAFYYQFWYTCGYLSMDGLNRIFTSGKRLAVLCRWAASLLLAAVSAASLHNVNLFWHFQSASIFNETLMRMVLPFITILPVLSFSNLFRKCRFLQSAGKASLYICGNEYIIRDLIRNLLIRIEIPIYDLNPLKCVVISILLVTAAWLLSFLEKWIAGHVDGILGKDRRKRQEGKCYG